MSYRATSAPHYQETCGIALLLAVGPSAGHLTGIPHGQHGSARYHVAHDETGPQRYRDYAISREPILWESQSATRADGKTSRRYQTHAELGT